MLYHGPDYLCAALHWRGSALCLDYSGLLSEQLPDVLVDELDPNQQLLSLECRGDVWVSLLTHCERIPVSSYPHSTVWVHLQELLQIDSHFSLLFHWNWWKYRTCPVFYYKISPC